MSITAMKQALEALNYLQGLVDTERGPKAAAALRQAIEQAEKQESVIGTKTWYEDGKVITQNLYPSDVYKQEKQEPVAWLCERDGQGYSFAYTAEQLHQLGYGNISVPPFRKVAPLYTAPQSQREWVGLTDEEKSEIWADCRGDESRSLDIVEAKLKEKNA